MPYYRDSYVLLTTSPAVTVTLSSVCGLQDAYNHDKSPHNNLGIHYTGLLNVPKLDLAEETVFVH